MELPKLKFWINLTLAIGTAYIVIWYLLTPLPKNQCQMTFMMEPPRFLPVPVDETIPDLSLKYSSANDRGPFKKADRHKLFMYSEFGFPLMSDFNRDLRDSMPVLFVPGNAGSYQQVRSLASTCIRHQLQSLDAFKFIFYTIDFGGQRSGLNGHLIEEQTTFVHYALNQIAKVHDAHTNGIILIGHSIGGFISKVLFTRPGFDSSSVPLVISLASPLTRPYLIFDDKMRELYAQTNDFWKNDISRINNTYAISLSGGKLDWLVPYHLSMDPQFDLSLTTSAVKGVWLATDHVSITWCKELMNKLAHMLSAVMDKRHTCLIKDKKIVESIVLSELLQTEGNPNQNLIKKPTMRDWKSMRSSLLIELELYYCAYRAQIGESIIVINATIAKDHGILIIVEHLGSLKENGVFACRDITFGSDRKHVACVEKIELMQLNFPIPTRRAEPKKTAFRVEASKMHSLNYIIFDFISYAQGYSNQIADRVPESIFVQKIDTSKEQALHVPSILRYSLERFFFSNPYVYNIVPDKNLPLYYLKYRLYNLKHKSKIFTIKLESFNCRESEHNRGATINFYQDGFLREAFHQDIDSKQNTFVVEAKISSSLTTTSSGDESGQDYLEFYIDGSCDNKFELELHFLDLVADIIQKSLGKLLACATYIAYISTISDAFNLGENQHSETSSIQFQVFKQFIQVMGFILIYISSELGSANKQSLEIDKILDELVYFAMVFTLSHGIIACLNHLVRRLIDLAIIVNNVCSSIRRLVQTNDAGMQSSGNGLTKNGTHFKQQDSNAQKRTGVDVDWFSISLVIAGSILFSGILNSLLSIFFVIKLGLNLEKVRFRGSEQYHHLSNKHCPDPRDIQIKIQNECVHEIISSIFTLCSLALISNIPAALTRFYSNELTSFDILLNLNRIERNFLASVLALILIKFATEDINSRFINRNLKDYEYGSFIGRFIKQISKIPTKHIHLFTLATILLIDSNLSNMNLALATSLSWLSIYLVKLPPR